MARRPSHYRRGPYRAESVSLAEPVIHEARHGKMLERRCWVLIGTVSEVDGVLRVRDLDAFLFEACENTLAEVVLRKILIRELPHLADQGKIQRRAAEARNKSYKRRGFSQQSRYLADRLRRLLYEDPFNMMG